MYSNSSSSLPIPCLEIPFRDDRLFADPSKLPSSDREHWSVFSCANLCVLAASVLLQPRFQRSSWSSISVPLSAGFGWFTSVSVGSGSSWYWRTLIASLSCAWKRFRHTKIITIIVKSNATRIPRARYRFDNAPMEKRNKNFLYVHKGVAKGGPGVPVTPPFASLFQPNNVQQVTKMPWRCLGYSDNLVSTLTLTQCDHPFEKSWLRPWYMSFILPVMDQYYSY